MLKCGFRFGRKPILLALFALSAVTSIAYGCLPKGIEYAVQYRVTLVI